MLFSAYQHKGLTAVRYPRGSGIGAVENKEMTEIAYGKGEIVRDGVNVAILSFGTLLPAALKAAEQLNCTVANMRFVKPLDTQLIDQLAQKYDLLVTVEENVIAGGAGSAVNEYLNTQHISIPTLNLGLPDQYIDHGSQDTLLAQCGLDAVGIAASIQASPIFNQIPQTPHKKTQSF